MTGQLKQADFIELKSRSSKTKRDSNEIKGQKMKKPEVKSTKKSDRVPFQLEPSPKVVEHDWPRLNRLDPVKICKHFPAPEQIAIIAATLVRTTDTKYDPHNLVDTAMELWIAARERLIAESENLENNSDIRDAIDKFGENIFHTSLDQFPITHDQFMKKVLPQHKSRKAKLTQIAKDYVNFKLHEKNKKAPTPEEFAAAYGNWPSCKNADEANAEAKCFLKWYHESISQTRRNAGKASAQKKLKDAPKTTAEK